jgi:hypothetical protein
VVGSAWWILVLNSDKRRLPYRSQVLPGRSAWRRAGRLPVKNQNRFSSCVIATSRPPNFWIINH